MTLEKQYQADGQPRSVWIVIAAVIAFVIKLAIAYNTIGTNDAVFFYGFAKVLHEHGLEWTYAHSRYFNHPPLTAYFLQAIYRVTEQEWCQDLGLHFPLLLRLPGIVADLLVVLILMQFCKLGLRIPEWALIVFAASPVSIMVSGFHGNTDPVMVLLLVCAVWMCLREQPVLAGLFFALSCQIKIVPLLFLPLFGLYWLFRGKLFRFAIPAGLTTCILWSEPLLKFPVLFAKNVLAYGSYWGTWGITYCLRLSGRPEFSRLSFFDLTSAQNIIVTALKLVIIAATIWIAWRNRRAHGRNFVTAMAYTWLIFFLFAPGVGVQYLIWLAPFVLVLSPAFSTCLLVASSIFLFQFYNITSGGLPWSVALAMDDSRQHWISWSLLPWFVLIAGSALIWKKINAGLAWRSFRLPDLRAGNA